MLDGFRVAGTCTASALHLMYPPFDDSEMTHLKQWYEKLSQNW